MVKMSLKRITFLVSCLSLIITSLCLSKLYTSSRVWILTLQKLTNSASSLCGVSDTAMKNYTETECFVSVSEETDEQSYVDKSDKCTLCNRHLFRQFHESSTRFTYQGSWNLLRRGGNITQAYIKTPFCSFSPLDLSHAYLAKCFASQRVRRIVTFGDSNGRNTFDALQYIVSSSLKHCRVVKREKLGFIPEMSYYLGPGNYSNTSSIILQKRNCRTCAAVQYECYYGKENHSLIMEHIPMNFIVEGSIRIRAAIKGAKPTNFTHEFIMRDYFRDNFPSILIVLIPCGHEWVRLTRNRKFIKDSLKHCIRDIKKYIPNTTQIYWAPYQYVSIPDSLKAIRLCNEFIFETLGDDFKDPKSNMHATFDTFQLSCPLKELRLSHDPYHLKPQWYDLYGRYILQQICNEEHILNPETIERKT